MTRGTDTARVIGEALQRETVLLVEDQDELREALATILDVCGYRVLAASRPEQAIEFAVRGTWTIDLLLTDLVLPRMNGRELAVRIRALRPDLRVLFMSGYSAREAERKGLVERTAILLEKPFRPERLEAAIRQLMDQDPPAKSA